MAMSNWQRLLAYVMKFGNLSQQQAEQWLDIHCPEWRSGPDVMAAGQIWMKKTGRGN
ncbi:hypothetical protein [Aeromonas hydrophila]|uniref:hypothetical protein n=1 Tax=Aeromonas TaxID=642 RepID=UPI002B46FBA8|nr:hypothetical protein [Aeromonas hydrophila]